MFNRSVFTDHITANILSRASSGEDVGKAIFDSLVEANVDWQSVTSDDVKPVLVKAIRASRTGRTNLPNVDLPSSISLGSVLRPTG